VIAMSTVFRVQLKYAQKEEIIQSEHHNSKVDAALEIIEVSKDTAEYIVIVYSR